MYQQYSQQPYYYQTPPNIIYEPYPQPIHIKQADLSNEKWAWAPRTQKMKWDLAESMDVDAIVRRGDLNSLKFYLESFVNVDITEEDSKKFGSKGALNLFLLMQIGIDYLLAQCQNYSLNSIISQISKQPQIDNSQAIIAQLQQKIEEIKSNINRQDSIIFSLRQQNAQLYDDKSKLQKKINKLKSKLRNEQFLNETTKKRKKPQKYNNEPGFISTLKGYEDFERLNHTTSHFLPNTITSSGNINLMPANIPSDQLSEGEIDLNGFTHNIGSMKRSNKSKNSTHQ